MGIIFKLKVMINNNVFEKQSSAKLDDVLFSN